MKKKLIICLMIVFGIFLITGCSTKKEEVIEEKKEEVEKEEEEKEDNSNRVVMPDVSGMTLEEAKRKIYAAGFVHFFYNTVEVESDVYSGLVVKTSPPAGSSFRSANSLQITFYISK